MRRIIGILTAVGLVANAGAAEFAGPPRAVPSLSTPLFPFKTGEEFFSGARRIVDLGGRPINWRVPGPWEALNAQGTNLEIVNTEEWVAGMSPAALDTIRAKSALQNMRLHPYDFFVPPEGHPRGDRVILNSPQFGGLQTVKEIELFVDMIDRHLEPGGYFYVLADDHLWLGNGEPLDAPQIPFKDRRDRTIRALQRHFGAENVSLHPLSNYSRLFSHLVVEDHDAAPGGLTLQLHKLR